MSVSVEDPWSGLTPRDVKLALAGDGPWWICGGWAVDLWLGRTTRPHADTDVGCFRCDLPDMLEAMTGWGVYAAENGTLTPLGRVARINGNVPLQNSTMHC